MPQRHSRCRHRLHLRRTDGGAATPFFVRPSGYSGYSLQDISVCTFPARKLTRRCRPRTVDTPFLHSESADEVQITPKHPGQGRTVQIKSCTKRVYRDINFAKQLTP